MRMARWCLRTPASSGWRASCRSAGTRATARGAPRTGSKARTRPRLLYVGRLRKTGVGEQPMAKPLYALEKLAEAVDALATGAGRVQERLGQAAICLLSVRPRFRRARRYEQVVHIKRPPHAGIRPGSPAPTIGPEPHPERVESVAPTARSRRCEPW
jgi:hypothetical protein